MKRFLKTLVLVAACTLMVTSCYDDSALKASIDDLKKQLSEVSAVVNDLKNGKVITNVTQTDKGYTFTMSDGKSIDVLNGEPGEDGTPATVIETKIKDGVTVFNLGDVIKVETNVTGVEVVDAFAPAGWAAFEENGFLTVTAPNKTVGVARKGSVIVVATAGNSLVLMTLPVAVNILDVNGSYWDALIDYPQYGGDLLYGPMDDATFTYNASYSWTDPITGLEFAGFPSYWGSVCFSSGGEAVSDYVEPAFKDAGYLRQLEVPVAPPTGKNFIVHFGDDNADSPKAVLSFKDNEEKNIKSLQFIPTNYLINSCLNGDGYFGPLGSKSMIGVAVVGYRADGKKSITFETLIDGADVPAYIAGLKQFEWKTMDLSVLGPVTAIGFEIYGSRDCYGDYGFMAPAYFAYCDIVVSE